VRDAHYEETKDMPPTERRACDRQEAEAVRRRVEEMRKRSASSHNDDA
jgi:hypothetical protein